MRKTLLILLLLLTANLYAQHDFFVLKKGNRTIATYHKGSYFAFRTEYGPWVAGIIKQIRNDSFYIQSSIVHYHLMGSDTQYLPVIPYALTDVVYLPGKGLKIDYINGEFRVNRGAGHVHFYWLRSGLLFRIAGIGYAALHLINSQLLGTIPFSWGSLGLAAGMYITGMILKRSVKFVHRTGKKYHFNYIRPAG